jgi:hypothetical protein
MPERPFLSNSRKRAPQLLSPLMVTQLDPPGYVSGEDTQ